MNKERHSFTLIELVAAMAVMVVIALILGSASRALYNGYTRTRRVSAELKERMAIDRVWDDAIRNMIPFHWADQEGTSHLLFDGTPDTLAFVTLRSNYGTDAGALLFIRLKLDDNQLVAEYATTPRAFYDTDENLPWTREVLAEKVRSISFEYAGLNSDGEAEFADIWDEEEKSDIPLAIRLTVEWLDGSREYWLRRTAGNSANSSLGVRADEEDQ